MTLDRDLSEAAAEFARRQAAKYGKRFRDGRDDPEEEEPTDATPALPTALHLTYDGDRGEQTERVVTLLSTWRSSGNVYLKARCHMRQATRTFRADRIVELVCLATGEIPDDPIEWLVDHALFEGEKALDYTPQALRLCRDELALLAYVGRADGHFDDDEIEVAVDYLMLSTDREIDRNRAAQYVRRLAPSIADMSEHLETLSRHPDRWPRLARAMRRLVDSDRRISLEEQTAWKEISEEFEESVAAREKASRVAAEREMAELLSGGGVVFRLDLSQPKIQEMVAAALAGAAGRR